MQVFRFVNQDRVLGNGASRLIHVPQKASPLFPVRTINQCDLGQRFGKQIFGAYGITCKPVGERERLALVLLEETHVVFAVAVARQQLHESNGPLFVAVSAALEQHDVVDIDRLFRVYAVQQFRHHAGDKNKLGRYACPRKLRERCAACRRWIALNYLVCDVAIG